MDVVKTRKEWGEIRNRLDASNSIGFVPTMGNLHAGHISLVDSAKEDNDIVVASIFINPTQFNDPEDYRSYPKTLNKDLEKLEEANVDYVFVPAYKELFPYDNTIQLWENQISALMEGRHRPSHFSGVLTVVMKLFNLIKPTRAYFGEKDYQQLELIRQMSSAFFMDVVVIGCETVRDETGLALSSRNTRLSPEEKQQASKLNQLLRTTYPDQVVADMLKTERFKVDYVETHHGRRFGAVWVGNVRLIDNVVVEQVHDTVY